MTFSDSVYVEFGFGLSNSTSFLRNAIYSAVQEGAGRYLAAAFDSVIDDVFENFQSAGRQSIVIYVTNGPTQDSNATLSTATQRLKDTGTDVFIVGVGSSVSQTELQSISSRIYMAANYSQIATVSYASQFLETQCLASVTLTTSSTQTSSASPTSIATTSTTTASTTSPTTTSTTNFYRNAAAIEAPGFPSLISLMQSATLLSIISRCSSSRGKIHPLSEMSSPTA